MPIVKVFRLSAQTGTVEFVDKVNPAERNVNLTKEIKTVPFSPLDKTKLLFPSLNSHVNEQFTFIAIQLAKMISGHIRLPVASFNLQVLKDDDGIILSDFSNVHYLDENG